MNVTIPKIGNLDIVINVLFNQLKIKYIKPPVITHKTYEIGFKLSPEQICLPFKISLGNLVEALELGADTIIMAGGNGPCRFGLYSVLQEKILKNAGYKFKMIVLDQDNIISSINYLAKIAKINILKLIKNLKLAWHVLKLTEENEKLASYYRAYCSNKLKVDKIEETIKNLLSKIETYNQVKYFYKNLKNYYLDCNKDIPENNILKVGLLGEIYIVLDDDANLNINKKLGYMNVLTKKTVYLSSWLKKITMLDIFDKDSHLNQKKIAQQYITSEVGGKGIQTIATAIQFAKNKIDGLIHLTPFSCMPELVATTILPKVCKDYNIDCLYLTFDEHTSKAGFITRLEAFVDMLKLKKEQTIKR